MLRSLVASGFGRQADVEVEASIHCPEAGSNAGFVKAELLERMLRETLRHQDMGPKAEYCA